MSNKVATQVMSGLMESLLNRLDQVEAEKKEIQDFLNMIIPSLKNGSLTLDRIRILENGEITILPEAPPEPEFIEVEPEVVLNGNAS